MNASRRKRHRLIAASAVALTLAGATAAGQTVAAPANDTVASQAPVEQPAQTAESQPAKQAPPAQQASKPPKPQKAPKQQPVPKSVKNEQREQRKAANAQKRADQQAQRQARQEAAQRQRDQRKAERAEAKAKKQEAKNGPKEAPDGGPAPAPSAATPATGTPPAQQAPSANVPAGSSTPADQPQSGGANDRSEANDRSSNRGSRSESNNGSDGSTGGGIAPATAAGGAALVPPGSDADQNGSGDGNGGQGDDESRERNRTTIVERVIREIPNEYRYAIGILGGLVLLLSGVTVRERRRSLRTERDMLIDGLTGVGSRRALDRQLAAEWKRAERHNRPLGLVLLDLDDLKEINDAFGHAAGDELLRSAGRSIQERVRESDTVARLGGDEFVVLAPETSGEGLEQLARSLQEDFRRLKVGVSVGFAERNEFDDGPEDLMGRADTAMYADKRAGIA